MTVYEKCPQCKFRGYFVAYTENIYESRKSCPRCGCTFVRDDRKKDVITIIQGYGAAYTFDEEGHESFMPFHCPEEIWGKKIIKFCFDLDERLGYVTEWDDVDEHLIILAGDMYYLDFMTNPIKVDEA